MTQELEQRRTPTAAQQLINTVRSERFQQEIALALPGNVTPQRFARIAVTALQANPDVANANPDSILRALIRCAQDGLLPDGTEAALVVFNVRDQGPTVQYLPMVGGLRKVAAEHGWTLRARAVYASDRFAWNEEPPSLEHQQTPPGVDRGPLVAAYAIATHRDGRRLQRVMTIEDINRRKAKARTDKVWKDWPAEMAEKTVAKDIFAELPLSGADLERIQRVIAADLEPDQAVEKLYGRSDSVADTSSNEMATSPQPPAEPAPEPQQAAAAVPNPPAAAAPGSDELVGEPGPDDPEPASPFQPPADVGQDPAVFMAEAASQVIVPIGQWKGRSLAEVHGAGEKGEKWLKYALANFDDATGTTPNAEPKLQPGQLIQAIRAFCAVYAPDLVAAPEAAA